jgi:hypothetical protein
MYPLRRSSTESFRRRVDSGPSPVFSGGTMQTSDNKGRVPLTIADREALDRVAVLYDTAIKFWREKNPQKSFEYRSRAASAAVLWANRRLQREDADDVLYGHNHPRANPLFDGAYDFRRWGFEGQIDRALEHVRKVLKRGYL